MNMINHVILMMTQSESASLCLSLSLTVSLSASRRLFVWIRTKVPEFVVFKGFKDLGQVLKGCQLAEYEKFERV